MPFSTSMPSGHVATASAALGRTPRFFVMSRLDGLSKLTGHLALAVSTVLASVEACGHINQRPKTVATNEGSTLEVVYDPVQKLVEYRFRILLRNDGTRDDVLKHASAALEMGDGGRAVHMDDVTVTGEGDARLPLPIPVGSRKLDLSTFARLEPGSDGVLRGIGERHLAVRLRTDGIDHTLRFCFDLTDSVASRLFQSGTLQTQPFRGAACRPTRGKVLA